MTDQYEGEEFEELEADQPELDGDDDGDEGHDDDDSPDGEGGGDPANRWQARRSLSELMRTEGKESEGPTGGDPEGDADEDDDDEQDPAREQGKAKAPAKDGTEEEPAATTARYTRLDAEGKPIAEPLLAKGQVIRFKGDGKEVAVSSDDELIQLAQKGAAFDRKTSELGRRAAALEQELRGSQASAEDVLMRVLFGYTAEDGTKVSAREARELLRPKLAKFRDPEFRAGREALAEKAAREAAAQEEQQQTVEEARTEFWSQVGEEIATAIEEFPNLTAEDAGEISQRFYAGYTAAFERAIAEGADEAAANQRAFEQLTSANLRRAMRGLNAELEGVRPRKPAGGKDPQREAEEHNRRVNHKVASRRTAPRLAGGGAPPGARPAARERGEPAPLARGETVFQRKIKGALSTLRSATRDE